MEKVKRLVSGELRREPEGRHLVCERKVLKWKKGKDTEGWRVAHLEECPLLMHKTLASIPTPNKQTGHGGSRLRSQISADMRQEHHFKFEANPIQKTLPLKERITECK